MALCSDPPSSRQAESFLRSIDFRALFIWMAWLLVGTIFYAEVDFNKNYSHGFYYAVNVGYSIGFGVLKENKGGDISYAFSTVYILCGCLAVSVFLSKVLDHALHGEKSPWYLQAAAARRRASSVHRGTSPPSLARRAWDYFLDHNDELLRIIVWLIYIVFGTAWSCSVIGWDGWQGLYFSVSSLSTGGLHGIPADSEDWVFFFVGLYCATGIPVMGLAMGALASMLMERETQKEEDEQIQASFSELELTRFDDIYTSPRQQQNVKAKTTRRETSAQGTVDRNEYLLLTLMRLEAVDADLVHRILDHFDERVDTGATGKVERKSIALPVALDQSQSVLVDDGNLDDTYVKVGSAISNPMFVL